MKRFSGKTRNPQELVRSLREELDNIEKYDKPGSRADKKAEKARDEATRLLSHMKTLICGSMEHIESPPQMTDAQMATLAQEIYSSGLLLQLCVLLNKMDFETRKDICSIFCALVRREVGTRYPTVEHLIQHAEVIFILTDGYQNQEIAMTCGAMLRECFKHEVLTKLILYSEHFYKFFDLVEMSTFDIASDAFCTFKDILSRHKQVCAEFLAQSYTRFFDQEYLRLLNSNNYVTRRQALKLLGELLLDRHNYTVMTTYIGNASHLKLMMNLLRSSSRNIQFEAFHVFKVFIANPRKPKSIVDILLRNQTKLVEFLTHFHADRTDDEQFNDEKAYLIKQIKDLKPEDAVPDGPNLPFSSTAGPGSTAAASTSRPSDSR